MLLPRCVTRLTCQRRRDNRCNDREVHRRWVETLGLGRQDCGWADRILPVTVEGPDGVLLEASKHLQLPAPPIISKGSFFRSVRLRLRNQTERAGRPIGVGPEVSRVLRSISSRDSASLLEDENLIFPVRPQNLDGGKCASARRNQGVKGTKGQVRLSK